MINDTIEVFAANLYQEILLLAESEGVEAFLSEAFTQYIIDELVNSGDLEDGMPCYFRARGMEVSGYYINPEGDALDLMVTIFKSSVAMETVTRSDLDTAFRRLSGFLVKALDGYHFQLEESSPIFDMFLSIYQARKTLERIRFFLLTNGASRIEHKAGEEQEGRFITYHIWDIQRIFRHVKSGRRRETIGSPGFPGVLHGFDADTCKVGFVFPHQKAILIDEQTFYSGKSWRAKLLRSISFRNLGRLSLAYRHLMEHSTTLHILLFFPVKS